MTDDIVARLRVPLPWMLEGMTTKQLGDERREAADAIEKLRKTISYITIQGNLMSAELERYKDLYAREAVERLEKNG